MNTIAELEALALADLEVLKNRIREFPQEVRSFGDTTPGHVECSSYPIPLDEGLEIFRVHQAKAFRGLAFAAASTRRSHRKARIVVKFLRQDGEHSASGVYSIRVEWEPSNKSNLDSRGNVIYPVKWGPKDLDEGDEWKHDN